MESESRQKHGVLDDRVPHAQGSEPLINYVFGELMHQPGPEKLEALLPANWIKTRVAAAGQTAEVPAA